MPEPLLDMSEIVGLYKQDACRMVQGLQEASSRWDLKNLRRLSHQLRGSGRTYGFFNVTRIGKALENIIFRVEKQRLPADERVRKAVSAKIERLAGIFES